MRYLLILLALSTGACSSTRQGLDHTAFKWFGGTVFSSPSQVSMKEIHLDNGALLGSEIIIEGSVVNLGEFATHLVMSDETARMLVVLTNLENSDDKFSGTKYPRTLRVLGTVERGKKGLPYVMAKALNPVKPSKG